VLKRLIILGLVVALVAVMSAPAALFATGGGGNDHNGKGKGHCKNIDKPGHKKDHKKCKNNDDKHHKKCKNNDNKHHKKCKKKKKKDKCDDNHNGITTPSEKEYCKDDDHGGHHGGHHGGKK
jgi:hypothetical protein